jgi:hypothetical protein
MASLFLFANNANTNLAAKISSSSVSLTVSAGAGTDFPNPTGAQQFEITMVDAGTGLLTEIIYVPTRTGDTFGSISQPLLRGQEGTMAQTWYANDIVASLVTAGQLAALQQTTQLFPARVVTASGMFSMSSSDANGGVGLLRQISPGVSSTTLPNSPGLYAIEDLVGNFFQYPVTVAYPGGTTGPNGLSQQALNIDGQCAYFRLYSGNNIWSFKP